MARDHSFTFELRTAARRIEVAVARNTRLFGAAYVETETAPDAAGGVGTVRRGAPPHHCHFHGAVVGDPTSVVAVSVCGSGMRGLIRVAGEEFAIEPLARNVSGAHGEHGEHVLGKDHLLVSLGRARRRRAEAARGGWRARSTSNCWW